MKSRSNATEDYREAILLRQFADHSLDYPNFGHLYWQLRVHNLSNEEVNELLDTLNMIDDCFYLFMEPSFIIEFDYYVHAKILPEIRATIDAYSHGTTLEMWLFCDF